MITKKEMRAAFKRSWSGGSHETGCGRGSTVENTIEIREALPDIIKMYDIRKINDAGCGDFNWIKTIEAIKNGEVDYQGYDIFDRKKRSLPFIELDICREKMRKCDLIICRDVFMHLPNEYVMAALKLFAKIGRYLFATSFPMIPNENREPMLPGQFRKINMESEPFLLHDPILEVKEPKFKRFVGLWDLKP